MNQFQFYLVKKGVTSSVTLHNKENTDNKAVDSVSGSNEVSSKSNL